MLGTLQRRGIVDTWQDRRIKPGPWQSEPVLKDFQVLPKDGKAIITFSPDTGDRDQVWTDIANAIEERAKQRTKCE
jgi:hypothetical protein